MIGVDFHTGSLDLREALAFDREDTLYMLPVLLQKTDATEAVLLSTCNRTELYVVSDGETFERDPAVALMAYKTLRPDPTVWTRKRDEEAVEHLFSVAAGLRSMVKGEAQILGQVKDAYRTATESAATGPYLNRIFHAAFRAGKRVRAETGISEGAVSVSQAAVEMACHEAPTAIAEASTLVIGAGEMAGLVVKHLVSKGAKKVSIANRTAARAACLAEPLGLEGHGLDSLKPLMSTADIVFSATSSDGYLVTRQDLSHRDRPLYMVDIGIPRTIAPEVGEIHRCTLRNIDALNGRVEGNLLRREEEARRGREIVREEVRDAMKWVAARENAPLIHSLVNYMENLRTREMERVSKEGGLTEREKLQWLSTHLVKKITQPIIKKINEARAEENQTLLNDYLGLLKEIYRI
jgi:glutamyl-tRNA reductase